MKFKFFSLLLAALFAIAYIAVAQKPLERNPKVKLPDIPGYITLKGDFHMHTVFSDGHVWPSFRVREAQRDGLDIISITEHMDYEGYPDEVEHDLERAFAIAEEAAQNTNVMVIRGVEISPRVAPFHNNAIFLKDVNKLPFDYMKQTHKKFVMKDKIKREELMAPFLEVKKQGGFVFYNHPGYAMTLDNGEEPFTDFHKELLEQGILGGVEVVNGGRYNMMAHRIAAKYNLTMFANSDAHGDLGYRYRDSHRPVTLVFARAKTLADIEEAIRAGRTAIYYEDYIIGRKPEVEPFFKASLTVTAERAVSKRVPQLKVRIKNNSDVPYEVRCQSDYLPHNLILHGAILKAHETTEIVFDNVREYPEVLTLQMQVENILVSPDEILHTSLEVTVEGEKP